MCLFVANKGSWGGSISTEDNGAYAEIENIYIEMVNTSISKCYAYERGGAIYQKGGTLKMLNGTEDNEVRFRGGAVSLHSGEAHIVGVHFIRNKAKEEAGGALHTYKNVAGTSVVNLTKTLFYKNAAPITNGGAIFVSNHYFLNVQNSSFDDNTAYKEGGAIYLRPSALADLRFSNFSNNQAVSRYGGAILRRQWLYNENL